MMMQLPEKHTMSQRGGQRPDRLGTEVGPLTDWRAEPATGVMNPRGRDMRCGGDTVRVYMEALDDGQIPILTAVRIGFILDMDT